MMKKNQFIVNSLMMLSSIIMTVALLEIGLRFFRPVGEPFDVAKPEEWDFLRNGEFTPSLNSLGFREEELSDDWFGSDSFRILFLGDSFTFGHGVADGADLFPSMIEEQLNENPEKEYDYHAYNAGRPGTEPTRWFTYLNELMPVYQPDIIVAVFFLRDGTELCTSLWCYEEQIDVIKSRYVDKWLYRRSHTARLWYNSQIANEFSDFYANEMIAAYLGDGNKTAVWEEQQNSLLQIRDVAHENGLEFHLVIFPVLYNLDENYPFAQIDQEIIRFADQNQIPVFSLTDGFIGENASQLWVSKSDQHPNARGHKIAAETLYPYLSGVIP